MVDSPKDPVIVDNSDKDWRVAHYLSSWAQFASQLDIATGYFEIGALLCMKEKWQQIDRIRILMGDEVSFRTKTAFEQGLARISSALDDSVEREKRKNDFLEGVPAIVEAIRSGKILCRVYRKDKFHAKAYITHAREAVIGSFALVGSSNFTYPGLNDNVELNVRETGPTVTLLQEWYERHWNEAEDITADMVRTLERHTIERPPFEVYVRSLLELFRGHEMSATEWELAGPEKGGSRVYGILDQYQRDGYHMLLKIGRAHGGAFLCDGVGLGKTFIGLMLIERLIMHERKRVALFVPKSARKAVWERAIDRYLPDFGTDFSNLAIFSHTDLQRMGEYPKRFQRLKEYADVLVIDEAHHFRNPGLKGKGTRRPSRYRQLFDIIEGPGGVKPVYMLTATPINNKLIDFQHMLELFSRNDEEYFKALGIHSVRGHFIRMEKELQRVLGSDPAEPVEVSLSEAEQVLSDDTLFRALVVQRSRAYVSASQKQQGHDEALFPTRLPPKVVGYSIKKTYGGLLSQIDKAFRSKNPLFALAIYYPLHYYRGPRTDIDPLQENRQKQVVGLIRTQFLKRFESSAESFRCSCERIMLKLLAFATKHCTGAADTRRLKRWLAQNEELVAHVKQHQSELIGWQDEEEAEEDIVSEEMLEAVEELDPDEYNVGEMLDETFLDLDAIVQFLDKMTGFSPKTDDKLQALIRLLKSDPVLKRHKVLIFTEFADTARYLKRELGAAGIIGLDCVDGGDKRDRTEVVTRFAPYYNGSSSAELEADNKDETRVLISTDVLAEGLNLQDATRLINYDIHWNPVRLMQRIGRVDRRMSADTEFAMLADHPDREPLRGRIQYFNFLPPDELDDLLGLYKKVAHKTLRISRTFGIEGRKLLKPDDDYEALKEFNHAYEGEATSVERLKLELAGHLTADPSLEARLRSLPGRVFSGKRHPDAGAKGVFLCYALPGHDHEAAREADPTAAEWSEAAGTCAWYLYTIGAGDILTDPAEIARYIRCTPDTPRECAMPRPELSSIRADVEKHIKNTYLKRVQAPIGVSPVLKCWMELC